MHIIRLSGLLPASYLAVRNDGDLTRHHSFLQGIYHMPGATNDSNLGIVIAISQRKQVFKQAKNDKLKRTSPCPLQRGNFRI